MIKTAARFDELPVGDLFVRVDTRGTKLGRRLAPDDDALRKYKGGEITWEQFAELYLMKIQRMWEIQDDALMTVARFVHDPRTLWLTCWEKESNPKCHRHILKQFIYDHAPALAKLK